MAMTSYGVNSPEAVKLWSKKLFHESFNEMYFKRFLSKSDSNIVHFIPEASKGAGDQVTCILRKPLDGPGVLGDSTLEGNEEQLKTFTDKITLNQLRNAHRSKGKMSEQRVPFSVRAEGANALKDWYVEHLEIAFFNQLCGFVPQNDIRLTGLNDAFNPDLDHYFQSGDENPTAVDDSTVTAGNVFTLDIIDCAVLKAKTYRSRGLSRIRPVRTEAGQHYVMFIHPIHTKQLRTGLGNSRWQEIQDAALSAKNESTNPIYTGAVGIYNNTVIHESEYITYGVDAAGVATDAANLAMGGNPVRRAVFCGAQAMGYGIGRGETILGMSNNEELFDYSNQLGQSVGAIFGLKKTRFEGRDFGSITVGVRDA